MTDFDELAKRYIDTWNITDEDERASAVAVLFADDATYVDPLATATGQPEIAQIIAAVQQQLPGFRFRLAGPVDGHHRQARFAWELGPGDVLPGEAPVVGFDVVVLADDDRLSRVHGFLDRMPGR